MSNLPNEYPYNITEWQAKLLSEIFRVIVREIKSDEDKTKLAPGELGINYDAGCFYIRNPYTGELFCPNSLDHVRQILSKFDPVTNIFNADKVSNIRFYSNISQLSQLGISMSPDTVIRQMEYPSVLISPVEYENYETLGYPSKSGVLTVTKISPEFVTVRYYDNFTYTYYDGQYNPFTQYFVGWSISTAKTDYVETVGGGEQTKINSNKVLEDLMILTVRVTSELSEGATISYNGGSYQPILNPDGTPLDHAIAPNNIIMLIYDEARGGWILADSSQSSISSVVSIEKGRIDELTKGLDHAVKDYTERLAQMQTYVDRQVNALKARPGVISTYTYMYTATSDNIDTIGAISNFNPKYDKLVINFNQTVLREDIDYQIELLNEAGTSGGIIFPKIRLMKDDTLQFIIVKQPTDTVEI